MVTIKLSYSVLCDIGTRLFDQAEAAAGGDIEPEDIVEDLKLGATIASKLASLRFAVGQIAGKALKQDPGATARDLREALEAAEQSDIPATAWSLGGD